MVKSNKSNNKKAKKIKKIFLDYSAGVFPNPSSIHQDGIEAKMKLNNAREEVAKILGSRPAEIIFTSGGTESNNIAIQGIVNKILESDDKFIPHIITTNIEHPSVLETCKVLEKRKVIELSIVSVEENGIIDPKKIKKEIKENTALVSVMYANNEIGTIEPIREIAKEIRHYRKNLKKSNSIYPLLHTDAIQAVNYIDLNVERLGVDMLSLSGSKIEKAGRVGVLYKKNFLSLGKVLIGGDQEMGLRPGTENLEAILRFTAALKSSFVNSNKEAKRLLVLRDYFIKQLNKLSKKTEILINGDLQNRLPNNVNVTFSKIPSDLIVMELSARGVMVSSKSACKSSKKEGSYVIEALRKNSNPEIGGVRFSFGKETSKKDIDSTIKSLSEILDKLCKWYN